MDRAENWMEVGGGAYRNLFRVRGQHLSLANC
jgi:hypothetical protein